MRLHPPPAVQEQEQEQQQSLTFLLWPPKQRRGRWLNLDGAGGDVGRSGPCLLEAGVGQGCGVVGREG